MNIHTTRSFTLTTGSATADGATVPVLDIASRAEVLLSQCTVQGELPAGVRLTPRSTPPSTPFGPQPLGVLVEGGTLPAGTVLNGMLSYVSSAP